MLCWYATAERSIILKGLKKTSIVAYEIIIRLGARRMPDTRETGIFCGKQQEKRFDHFPQSAVKNKL
jgi:hypothetical protein